MANKIPVYVFTGFLEGGKTHIIQESMEDQRFNSGEKTLLIMCEEGIEELDLDRFWGKNVYLELLDDPEMLTRDYLTLLYKKHKIDRVIIEYNGMWLLSKLYAALPADWFIFQNMMFADAKTFLTYNANMRQLMVDKLQDCEMIVLNRTPEVIDKEEIHRVVRSVSTRASITYDYPDGHVEYDEIEDPLPFDIDAPVIDIKDEDYAVWYRDLAEDTEKYDGKTVRFKGIVARDRALGKNGLVIGRHVMTCCADDIAYNALVCYFPTATNFKTRDWTVVTAKIKIEKHKLYGRPGPVLYAEKTEFATKPTQEVATFY
ncbi:MAG: GTPase [Clostridia bacterium]|nr:GTPase [Clostridia bacterium]MBO7297044.1 GTPase [Clostridia bacterium]